jgi:hypothetical protein
MIIDTACNGRFAHGSSLPRGSGYHVAQRRGRLAVGSDACAPQGSGGRCAFPELTPRPGAIRTPCVMKAGGNGLITIARAVLIGMLIMLAGTIPRNLLFAASLRHFASVPWAVPLTAFYL